MPGRVSFPLVFTTKRKNGVGKRGTFSRNQSPKVHTKSSSSDFLVGQQDHESASRNKEKHSSHAHLPRITPFRSNGSISRASKAWTYTAPQAGDVIIIFLIKNMGLSLEATLVKKMLHLKIHDGFFFSFYSSIKSSKLGEMLCSICIKIKERKKNTSNYHSQFINSLPRTQLWNFPCWPLHMKLLRPSYFYRRADGKQTWAWSIFHLNFPDWLQTQTEHNGTITFSSRLSFNVQASPAERMI